LSGWIDHCKRRVSSAGELGRRFDDPLEEGIEREFRAQGDARVDEDAEPIDLVRRLIRGCGHPA
jgi:hypothetical protein